MDSMDLMGMEKQTTWLLMRDFKTKIKVFIKSLEVNIIYLAFTAVILWQRLLYLVVSYDERENTVPYLWEYVFSVNVSSYFVSEIESEIGLPT